MSSQGMRRGGALLAGAAVLLLGPGIAIASIPDPGTGAIHGCYSRTTGALRVIDVARGQRCARTETALNFLARGINWRGAWTPAVGYHTNDAVSYKGSSYVSLRPHQAVIPPNAGYWGVLSTVGATGAKGATGATGATGAKGETGTTGAQGPVGPRGPKGDTGARGPTGATGPQGPVGPAGPTGPAGQAGTAATTYWAVVKADAVKAEVTSTDNSNVLRVFALGTGDSVVVFTRNVRSCAMIATLQGTSGEISATSYYPSNTNAVRVQTADSAGAAKWASYSLSVFCG